MSTADTSATSKKFDEMTTGSAESLFSVGGVGSRMGSAHISGVTSAGVTDWHILYAPYLYESSPYYYYNYHYYHHYFYYYY